MGTFQVGIFQVGVILGGSFPGGDFPGGSYPGWEFSLVGVFRMGIVLEGIIRVEVFLVPKESPRVTFERTKRVSQPEFTNEDL